MKRSLSPDSPKPTRVEPHHHGFTLSSSEQSDIRRVVTASTNSGSAPRAAYRPWAPSTVTLAYPLSTTHLAAPVRNNTLAGTAPLFLSGLTGATMTLPLLYGPPRYTCAEHHSTYFARIPADVWLYQLLPYFLHDKSRDTNEIVDLLPLLVGARSYPVHTHLFSLHRQISEQRAQLWLDDEYATPGTLRTPLRHYNDTLDYATTYQRLQSCQIEVITRHLTDNLATCLRFSNPHVAAEQIGLPCEYHRGFYCDKLEVRLIYALHCWLELIELGRSSLERECVRLYLLGSFIHTALATCPEFDLFFVEVDPARLAATSFFYDCPRLYPYHALGSRRELATREWIHLLHYTAIGELDALYAKLLKENFGERDFNIVLLHYGTAAQVHYCVTRCCSSGQNYAGTFGSPILHNRNPGAVAAFFAVANYPRIAEAYFSKFMSEIPPGTPSHHIIPFFDENVWDNFPYMLVHKCTDTMQGSNAEQQRCSTHGRILYHWLLAYIPVDSQPDKAILRTLLRLIAEEYVDTCLPWTWLADPQRVKYCQALFAEYQPHGTILDVVVYYRQAYFETITQARLAGCPFYVPPHEPRLVRFAPGQTGTEALPSVIITPRLQNFPPDQCGPQIMPPQSGPAVERITELLGTFPHTPIFFCEGTPSLLDRAVALLARV